VQAGQVGPSAARAELRTIRARVADDNRIVSATFDGIGQRVTAYVDTTNAVTRADQAISASRARSVTPNVSQVRTQTQVATRGDAAARAQVDADIEALQVLLG
jgi:hypothetical protein